MIRKTLLALCWVATAATLVLGAVSYWQALPDKFIWIRSHESHPRVQVAVVGGIVHAVRCSPFASGPPPWPAAKTEKRLGPFYAKRIVFGASEGVGVGAPFWAPAMVFAFCPAVAVVRGPLRRRRRRKHGECLRCGYSLTGLTEPRCPECGTSIERCTPPTSREEELR